MRKSLIAVCAVVILSGSMLSGCNTPQIVVQTKAVVPEDSWLVNCDIAPPPAEVMYMHVYATPVEDATIRERYLAKYSRTLIGNLATCNKRWESLRGWKEKTLKEFPPPKAGVK